MCATAKPTNLLPSGPALRDKDSGSLEDVTHPALIGRSVTNGKAMNNDDTVTSTVAWSYTTSPRYIHHHRLPGASLETIDRSRSST
jgi:hypothetical protein